MTRKNSIYLAFICLISLCYSSVADSIHNKDVALNEGEIKVSKERHHLLKQKQEELEGYLVALDSYDDRSIAQGRPPIQCGYKGVGGIKIMVFGVSSDEDFFRFVNMVYRVFQDTNVRSVFIEFYDREIVHKAGNVTEYRPESLVFEIFIKGRFTATP